MRRTLTGPRKKRETLCGRLGNTHAARVIVEPTCSRQMPRDRERALRLGQDRPSTEVDLPLHHLCARLCVSLSVGEGERASARRARASALCTLSTTRLEVRDRSKTHHSVGTCAMREGWCIVRPARLCVCAGLSGCVCGLHGALTDIALLCVLLLVI